MKKYLSAIIITLVVSVVLIYADDWKDGLTTDLSYATMSAATVENVSIKGDYIFATITQEGHSKIFYSEKTNRDLYATLLTAISAGRTVKVYFSYDSYSPDINWFGIIATHKIVSLELK